MYWTFGDWILYMAIFAVLVLVLFGGNMLILSLSGSVDENNKGGPLGRTASRYAREKEQEVYKEGLPILFGVIGIGGIIAICGFLNMFMPGEQAADVVIKLIFFGALILIGVGFIVAIVFAIIFLLNVVFPVEENKYAKK